MFNSDEKLNSCAKQFSGLYDKYSEMVYNMAHFYLKDPALARDIVQETFAKLWEMRDEIDIKHSLKNYIYTIAKNLTLRTIERRNREIVDAYEIERCCKEGSVDILEQIYSDQRDEELRRAIDKLPSNKRTICLMKIDYKMSNQEIADKLKITPNTVKSHYNSAIKMLRESVDWQVILPTVMIMIAIL